MKNPPRYPCVDGGRVNALIQLDWMLISSAVHTWYLRISLTFCDWPNEGFSTSGLVRFNGSGDGGCRNRVRMMCSRHGSSWAVLGELIFSQVQGDSSFWKCALFEPNSIGGFDSWDVSPLLRRVTVGHRISSLTRHNCDDLNALRWKQQLWEEIAEWSTALSASFSQQVVQVGVWYLVAFGGNGFSIRSCLAALFKRRPTTPSPQLNTGTNSILKNE